MKDFQEFRDSFSDEKIKEICISRIEKVSKEEETRTFSDSVDRLIWMQRRQTIGFIFDFLEEYHKWLNA